MEYMPPPEQMRAQMDSQQRSDIARTASEAGRTRELLDALVLNSVQADTLERTMLRWTVAGVVLAGIAAVASVVAIVIAIVAAA